MPICRSVCKICKFEPICVAENGFALDWRSFPRLLALPPLTGLLPAALLFRFFLLHARIAQLVQLGLILFVLPPQPPLVQAQVFERLGFGHFRLRVQQQALNGRVRVLEQGLPPAAAPGRTRPTPGRGSTPSAIACRRATARGRALPRCPAPTRRGRARHGRGRQRLPLHRPRARRARTARF